MKDNFFYSLPFSLLCGTGWKQLTGTVYRYIASVSQSRCYEIGIRSAVRRFRSVSKALLTCNGGLMLPQLLASAMHLVDQF